MKAILVRIVLVSMCLVFVVSSGLEAQEGFGVDLDVVTPQANGERATTSKRIARRGQDHRPTNRRTNPA